MMDLVTLEKHNGPTLDVGCFGSIQTSNSVSRYNDVLCCKHNEFSKSPIIERS
jgi:hypothetical protein